LIDHADPPKAITSQISPPVAGESELEMIKGSIIGDVLYEPPSIEHILQDEVTRRVFDKLVRRGVNKSMLKEALCNIPVMPMRLRYLFPGDSSRRWKSTRRFCEQIEKLATDIERFNKHTWLLAAMRDSAHEKAEPRSDRPQHRRFRKVNDETWLCKRTPTKTLDAFRSLPEVLRAYVVYFRLAVRLRRPDVNLQKILIIELLDHIKRYTQAHRCYFEDVAQLLGAAFFAAGRPRSKEYTADALRKLYGNHPHPALEATFFITLPENYWLK
jgi:hypothetical protein